MHEFSAEGVQQLEMRFFMGGNEILLIDKTLKFRVIFQKYALKLIKIFKIIEKIREKMQNFANYFNFR